MSTANLVQKLSNHEKFTIAVLCSINLFNHMDRHCIAGVLLDVQQYFDIEDDLASLIQTGFTVGYTLSSPLYGFLGDRFSRKFIMVFSIALWIVMGLINTVVANFTLFVITRVLVGIGESGFTVLAPSMIADLVTEGSRSIVFALFYYALPVGTGLGFAVSATVNQLLKGRWWWALRATPLLNAICLFFLLFAIEPKRGAKDAAALGGVPAKPTSYIKDLRYLITNRTFVLLTLGYTFLNFICAAVAWWGPKSLSYGVVLLEGEHGTDDGIIITNLGILSIFTGIFGVSIGSGLSRWLRPKFAFIDPIIVALGLILATPFYMLSCYMTPKSMVLTFVFIFLAQLTVNVNWAVVMDILMYVIVPTRRASAKAIETFISHILGNTLGTSMVGIISEAIQDNNNFTDWHHQKPDNTTKIDYGAYAQNFYGLQIALLSTMGFFVVAGLFFIWTAFYVVADKEKASEKTVEK